MTSANSPKSLVLYCLIRKKNPSEARARFLLVEKQGSPAFPPTKFRPGEDLYHALVRPMEDDLGLPPDSYFPELELEMIPNSGESIRYPGVTKEWNLYPVDVSLDLKGWESLAHTCLNAYWWTIDEILQRAPEPNVRAIAEYIRDHRPELLSAMPQAPSMDAIASAWSAGHREGVRIVRMDEVARILSSGGRAFNLRVADPYLPYQRQGFGFTWSFFTPKDKQDLHLHGLPAVEIYGILQGRFQLWSKPMDQRGVRTWKCATLMPGDWAEVEPLNCHFGCWLDREGIGTVIKAAAVGELAGVGRIGVAGKTICEGCSMHGQCTFPPTLVELMAEYKKEFNNRDYDGKIPRLAADGEFNQNL
jgi:hypothetical protein